MDGEHPAAGVRAVNLAGYPTERRAAMTSAELVNLWGIGWDGVPTCDALALIAATVEARDDDVLVGWVADCGELAGDLRQPFEVRQLAACLARVCEGVLTDGLADWDAVGDLIMAGKAAHDQKGESDGSTSHTY